MKESSDFDKTLRYDEHNAASLQILSIEIEIARLEQMERQTYLLHKIACHLEPPPEKVSRWTRIKKFFTKKK